jgi:penicillin-binding protein activator
MQKTILSLFVLLSMALVSCGPKVYTQGQYDDPNRVELLDDKFNEADMQQMADTIVDAIIKCEEIKDSKKAPTIALAKVANRTEEHIDTDSLTDMIRTNLIKSRKVKFIDRKGRTDIDEEYAYGETGKVSRETQKKGGKQIGVDYLLAGALATNIQEVSNDKLIYYKLTMNLTNTETSVIDCSEEKQIRKKYRKRSTGIL